MKEIWRDIKGFEGIFRVSNYGRIMGYPRRSKDGRILRARLLTGCKYSNGYLVVNLKYESLIKRVPIHRLVAETFIPNPYNLPMVNHKDENKTNNRVDNLEWCDAKYNTTYGTARDRMRNSLVRNKSKRIRQYSLAGEFIQEFPSIADASNATGAKRSEICSCCKQKESSVSSKGFLWRYADECADNIIPPYSKKPSSLMRSVSQYTTNGDFIKTYRCIDDAMRETGTRHSGIYNCCVGRYKSSNGYIWRYNN